MELGSYFEKLREAVEPEEDRKKEAQKADDPVREHLESHESFADRHVKTFLYGSYRRNTAEGDIKDVDIVVVTNYTINDNPLDVLNDLKESLVELYGKADLADQRRSIRVDRPLPNMADSKLTLDVIPAIYQDKPGGPLWVPDRDKRMWVASHPEGHIEYSSSLNAESHNGVMFVRLVKMLKWWWRYQFELKQPDKEGHERKPKGFWIEVMTGQYANLSKKSYPELIISVFESALNAFRLYHFLGQVPELKDPGLPDQTIKTSMTQEEFSLFFTAMEESLKWAKAGFNATTEEESALYWQLLFGDKFPTVKIMKDSANLLSPAAKIAGLTFPNKPIVPNKPGGFA
jgi:predicted nucleotidyltransferase